MQQDKAARLGGILGYARITSTARSASIFTSHFAGKLTPFSGASNTPKIGAIAGHFEGAGCSANNSWWLTNSAPAAFGYTINTTVTNNIIEGTATQFADGTVTTSLGASWQQGATYPILKAPSTPAGIEEITNQLINPSTNKLILHNGELYIIRDGKVYSINGHLIYK